MSVTEGARRMKHAGRWMVSIPLGAFTLLLGLSAVPGAYANSFQPFHSFVLLFFPFAFIGAVLWLAGWIVEGFAEDPH